MEEILKVHTSDPIYDDDPVAKAAFENFGIAYLYPWQRLVIANILEAYKYHVLTVDLSEEDKALFDRNNTDSFCKGRQIVLLPTGAGKSLCFQIPALLLDGPTLIIYPLLALMTDQQRRMEEGALRSVVFRGGQSRSEREENFRKIREGAKIILANPEVLCSDELINQLKETGIKHIAIDEAHCTSAWGNTFRSAYLELGKVIEKINPPVITAFTATASPQVLENVSEILFGGLAHIVRSESDRPNIHYFVRKCVAKKKEALYLAAKEARPMIIFCGTRNNSHDMAVELNACFGPGTARFYHAGLEKSEKEEVEKWFYNSKNGILCATCAYGMGVDKKDIKTVLHIQASESAEAYIQEAGRGGRDGSIAKAILLWSPEDSVNFGIFKEGSRERAMKEFAETKDCRRQVLLDALGAEQAVCSGCDLCNGEKPAESDYDLCFSLVRKRKHFYSKEELMEELNVSMNYRYRKTLGVNVWNNSDSIEVLRQLMISGRIKESGRLWKGKLEAVSGKKALPAS